MAVYAGYLTLSALANEPLGKVTVGNATRDCETFKLSTTGSENTTLAVGLILTFLMVVYSRYDITLKHLSYLSIMCVFV